MTDLLSPTASILFEKYRNLTIDMTDLASELHYASRNSILNAVGAGTCPVRTFLLGSRRVCDIRDLADYLDQQRDTKQR